MSASMSAFFKSLPAEWTIESLIEAVEDAILVHGDEIEKMYKLVEANLLSGITGAFDLIFAPKLLLRQIVMIGTLQTFIMLSQYIARKCGKLSRKLTTEGRREDDLLRKLKSGCSTYEEWQATAQLVDEMRGHDKWRRDDKCALYDAAAIKKRIDNTKEMLNRGDVFDLMFRLRGGLARDQFGMQHSGLFAKAMAGTKLLVEEYHEVVAAGLNFVCDSPIADEEISLETKLAFFNETRHSYGRTALLLSGGAYLGFYHMGVVKTLWQSGMLPRVISGASAGSIMAAVIGTRTDEEFAAVFNDPSLNNMLPGFEFNFFRFSDRFHSKLATKLQYMVPQQIRWLTQPILSALFDKKVLNLDTTHFKDVLMRDVGLYTFQEAFDHTGRIINITVAPLNNYDPPRLLNYLTAPHVCVWSAAAASCALPGIFDSINLIVKEPNGLYRPEHEWTRQSYIDGAEHDHIGTYSDGSLESDLPMQQLSELFNVNHFIVSQVNPHSAILTSMNVDVSIWSSPLWAATVGYLRFLKAQFKDFMKNVINLLVFQTKAPVWSARRGASQTLTQEYEGRDVDINITPWRGHISTLKAFASVIKNPTDEEYQDMVRAAASNTFSSVARVKAHCSVESTLDKCVQRLRKRISDNYALEAVATKIGVSTDKITIDRTPSFYTSRSIINLSGLSVSDPAPRPYELSPEIISQIDSGNENASAGLEEGEDAFLTLSVPAGDIPLNSEPLSGVGQYGRQGSRIASPDKDTASSTAHTQKSSSEANLMRPQSMHNAASGSLQDTAKANLPPNKSADSMKTSSSESLNKGIHKTTSMAKFYYKKSRSEDELSKLVDADAERGKEKKMGKLGK